MTKLFIYGKDDRPISIIRSLYRSVGLSIDNFQAFCKGYKIFDYEDFEYNQIYEIELDSDNYDLFLYISIQEPTCVLSIHDDGEVMYYINGEYVSNPSVELPMLNKRFNYPIVNVNRLCNND